jgi:hypothetical protein
MSPMTELLDAAHAIGWPATLFLLWMVLVPLLAAVHYFRSQRGK